jgi:hypothetical protein
VLTTPVQQCRRLATEQNPNVQMILPMAEPGSSILIVCMRCLVLSELNPAAGA